MLDETLFQPRGPMYLKNCFVIESLLEKTNFWQNILERLVNVTLTLAKYNLPFRGSSEELSKDNKGNFLSIIQLLAKYDTVLDKFLQLPKNSPKYLSSFYTK